MVTATSLRRRRSGVYASTRAVAPCPAAQRRMRCLPSACQALSRPWRPPGEAAAKITDDEDGLLAFCDYPAGHWVRLGTTSPVESAFATVRLGTKVTKGHGCRAAGLAMAFKLIESAQRRWRMVNAPHLVALVRAGATIVSGKLIERPDDQLPAADSAAPAAARDVTARAA